MPLGVREVLIVMRAESTASPAIQSLVTQFGNLDKAQQKTMATALANGKALMTVGATVGVLGAAGLAFYSEATKQAVDYNKQVALTKTQMFGVKASFDQVAKAGLDVANTIAVPLDQIQMGLYDIFSSMDVNLTQAKYLLVNFSKEAVAGQVTLNVAERATIGIMNAYQLKVRDVARIQDIMFNLVKYGVGTYENFANVIGRVTGPAVRANQTFEQTAALMAFTTRNGLSAANAASSVGRALDAIGKSRDKIANFGRIVVSVLGKGAASGLNLTARALASISDNTGKLLSTKQVVANLSDLVINILGKKGAAALGITAGSMAGITSKTGKLLSINKILKDFTDVVTKGLGGKTASALGITADSMIKMTDAAGKLLPINVIMTELGTALKGLNPTQLNDVLTAMFKGSGGTIQAMRFLDIAVHNFGQLNGIVKEMGASKGALQAAYNIMANTPAMQIQLLKNNFHSLMIEIGTILLPILNKFTIYIKDVFQWLNKIPHPILVISTIAGVFTSVLLVLAGAVIFLAGAFVIASTAAGLLDIVLAPILALVALVIVAIIGLAVAAYFIYKYWRPISVWFHNMWFDMWHWIDKIWGDIWKSIKGYWDDIVGVFNNIKHWFTSNFNKWWKTHGDSIKIIWKYVWDFVGRYIKLNLALIIGAAKIFFAIMSTIFKIGIALWMAVFKIAWAVIVAVFKTSISVIVALWHIFWAIMVSALKLAWAGITFVFKSAWDIIAGIFSIFIDLMTGHWHQAWVDFLSLGKQLWNNIRAYLSTIWHVISGLFIVIFRNIESVAVAVWHNIYNATHSIWSTILGFFHNVWGDLRSGFTSVVHDLGTIWGKIEDVFKTPVNYVIRFVYDDGIAKVWNTVVSAIGLKSISLPIVNTLASGGRLPGFGGGDRNLALLEDGEAVVDKHRTRKYASVFKAMGVPGFASGGIVGGGGLGGLLSTGLDFAKMALAVLTNNPVAFANAMAGTFLNKTPVGSAGNYAKMLTTMPGVLVQDAVKGVWKRITTAWNSLISTVGSGGGSFPIGAGPGGGNAAANMALAQSLMPGWSTGLVWQDWAKLWNQESGWNQYAYNAGSGATGIPQSLPYTKMPRAAWLPSQGGSANVRAQESWGINYIQGRYGTPVGAWGHEVAFNWYDNGGFLPPGMSLAYNGTGKPERIPSPRGGDGTTQNFFIRTQEIDPRRHAAELGWELARRSG